MTPPRSARNPCAYTNRGERPHVAPLRDPASTLARRHGARTPSPTRPLFVYERAPTPATADRYRPVGHTATTPSQATRRVRARTLMKPRPLSTTTPSRSHAEAPRRHRSPLAA